MTDQDTEEGILRLDEDQVRLLMDQGKAHKWLGFYRLAVEFDRRRDEEHLEIPEECTTIRAKAVFMTDRMRGEYAVSEDQFIRDPSTDATMDEITAYVQRRGRFDDLEPHPEGTRFSKPIAARWEPPVSPILGRGAWPRDHPDNPWRQPPAPDVSAVAGEIGEGQPPGG